MALTHANMCVLAEAQAARAEQAEAAALALAEPCRWTLESGGEYWDTACGQAYVLEFGTPAEHEYDFCPKCGHPLAWGDADEAPLFTQAELDAADKGALDLLRQWPD